MESPDVVTFPSGTPLRIVPGPVAHHEEHWDPQRTGNPLLDAAPPAALLAPDFTVGELTRSGGNRFPIARVDPELVRCLQAVRDLTETPVIVTSGYRSWAYNERLYERRGRRPTLSRHCCGQAADVRIGGMSGVDIAKAAIEAYGRNLGVGIGSDNAHLDVRGSWARWTYLDGVAHRHAIEEIEAFRRSRRGLTPLVRAGEDHSDAIAIDVDRAVARNRHHARELGWGSLRAQIGAMIGIAGPAASDEDFARAVAAWQSEQQGLVVDGIIGPNTWARIRQVRPEADAD